MKSRILVTKGDGKFIETEWDKPEPTEDEIEVRAVMTGVCRSDIDMMTGKFPCLPEHMSGHEGLGVVTKIGDKIAKQYDHLKIGDYVATRGEPAYSDFYNVRNHEFVTVPELHEKYILEPVACGINLIQGHIHDVTHKTGKIAILGSGFLAQVVYQYMTKELYVDSSRIDVFGSSNREYWGDKLQYKTDDQYGIIIDLSNKDHVFTKDILNVNAIIIFGVQKTVTTDFSNLLWKACTMYFPSPRSPNFYLAMNTAKHMISTGEFDTSKIWTHGYDRDTNWANAFTDGLNRTSDYNRGFIKWE